MYRLPTSVTRFLTPTNLRAARLALMLAATVLAVAHPGLHVPHVLADDDFGGP